MAAFGRRRCRRTGYCAVHDRTRPATASSASAGRGHRTGGRSGGRGDLAADEERESVSEARRFVRDQLLARGAGDVVDDATLVAAELLANARQHGSAP